MLLHWILLGVFAILAVVLFFYQNNLILPAFATSQDKEIFFSKNGKAFAGIAVSIGVVIVNILFLAGVL